VLVYRIADWVFVVAGLSPNSGLLGSSPEDAALVDQWTHLAETEVHVYTIGTRSLTSGQIPYNKVVSMLSLTLERLVTISPRFTTHTRSVKRVLLIHLRITSRIEHTLLANVLLLPTFWSHATFNQPSLLPLMQLYAPNTPILFVTWKLLSTSPS
jgi:hypothetical protein